jgi:REase_DpnII-MboI
MPEARASLIEAWRGFKTKGLGHTNDNPEFDISESPALTFLERVIQGLRISVSEAISSEQAWTLSRLEAMLRDTPALVHRRRAVPANEIELQEIMHDYLSACFPDFRENPAIGGTLKNFKPDCGIAGVGAAIEFKIVHAREQMAFAFSGVAEDTAGYKGSKDWTRFYAVIYQAQPFTLESHLRSDLKRIGAATWDTDRREWTHRQKAQKEGKQGK